MTATFEAFVAQYGPPHQWTPWHWWINVWRYIAQNVEIRVIIDVALHCPDEKLTQMARAKFGPEFDLAHLDVSWPGRGCFKYDWEGLIALRAAREDPAPDPCTCPKDSPDRRDKDCPTHGLATLVIPDGLREYLYSDGICVMAESESSADEMHARMAAYGNRS